MGKVITVIIVLVVLAGGGWYLYQHNHKSTPSPATNTAPVTSSQSMSKGGSSTTSGEQTAPAATTSVTIANMAFTPANITVKKGTSVTWTNQDSTHHTVTADNTSQANLHSAALAKGESYTFTFNTTGSFHYHCSIHPFMTGSVTVTE